MAKNDYYLNHARHNEQVCNYLNLKQEFADWIITTAFYASLHYVAYKVFPYTIKSSGKSIEINSIEQYQNFLGQASNRSRHQLLAKLADEQCKPVSEDYRWLLDMSMNARYINYQHLPQVAQKACSLLEKIKKHCSK